MKDGRKKYTHVACCSWIDGGRWKIHCSPPAEGSLMHSHGYQNDRLIDETHGYITFLVIHWHLLFFYYYYFILFLSIYHQKQLPHSLTEWGTLCENRWKPSTGCVPCRRKRRRREEVQVCLWHCSCLLTLDVFFCELGQVSNKSPPPIAQCPSRFTLGAMESWPKKTAPRGDASPCY